MSSSKKQQRVPLDLFLSGMLNGSLGEKDHPVIVVDESKRRSFPHHTTTIGTSMRHNNSRSMSGSSFCSSVTSCSIESASQAALNTSRWESMPRRNNTKNADTKLGRAPNRDSAPSLRRPARTRTNELTVLKKTTNKQVVTVPTKALSMARRRSARRSRSMRCDSNHSKNKRERCLASI